MFDYFTKTHNQTPNPAIPIAKPNPNPKFISKKERGFNWCDKPLCRYCPLLDKTGFIICTYTQEKFTTMKNISCRSSNVIYSITCKVCKIQYVGQTRRQLQARFAGHFNDVLNSFQHKPVSAHFSQRPHRGTKDFLIHILEFIRKPAKSTQAGKILLRREAHWVNTLRTHAPIGLNLEDPKEFKGYKA
ncbi:MAG: GIY-YIG nuclease family protein [Desulfobulbaceae bacterium]|nr:GIY-YIG nuclease family protein [Desulfobulbaceae bacterium]